MQVNRWLTYNPGNVAKTFSYQRILICCFFNALLFWVVLFFCTPIYNSVDDVMCLYLLGGGFGETPTELLHFNHLLNPIITIPIKFLFVQVPGTNWYSWLLISMHFGATSIIFLLVNHNRSFAQALLIYSSVFIIFEASYLMNLTFTNTSIILSCAAILLLLVGTHQAKRSLYYYVFACICFVLAALFRIHTIIPFAIIAVPFLFFPVSRKKTIRLLIAASITVTTIFLSNQFHRSYYTIHIPNWPAEEAYRQKLYPFYNKENALINKPISGLETERNLIRYNLAFDTTYISSAKLTALDDTISGKRLLTASPLTSEHVHWFFANNKIYLAALIIFIWWYRITKRTAVLAASLLALAAMVVFLAVFFKLPNYFMIGATALMAVMIIVDSNIHKRGSNVQPKTTEWLLLAVMLCFGAIRLYKTDITNRNNHALFIQAVSEIEQKKDTLFLVMDDSFPIDYFSVFDIPSRYPLQNVSLRWNYSQELNRRILRRFNINSAAAIPYTNNVLLWGKQQQALLDYFKLVTGKNWIYSPIIPTYKSGAVTRLTAGQANH